MSPVSQSKEQSLEAKVRYQAPIVFNKGRPTIVGTQRNTSLNEDINTISTNDETTQSILLNRQGFSDTKNSIVEHNLRIKTLAQTSPEKQTLQVEVQQSELPPTLVKNQSIPSPDLVSTEGGGLHSPKIAKLVNNFTSTPKQNSKNPIQNFKTSRPSMPQIPAMSIQHRKNNLKLSLKTNRRFSSTKEQNQPDNGTAIGVTKHRRTSSNGTCGEVATNAVYSIGSHLIEKGKGSCEQ